MLEAKEKAPKKSGQQAQGGSWKNKVAGKNNKSLQGRPFRQGMGGVSRFPPVRSPPVRNGAKHSPNLRPSGSPPNRQSTPPKLADRMQTMNLDENGNHSPRSQATSGDGERRERGDSIPKSI